MKNKKLVVLLLTGAMALSTVACAQETEQKESEESKATVESTETASASTETVDDGITFPLKEEVTFTLGCTLAMEEEMLEKCALWNELYEETNVKFELVVLPTEDPMTKLNAMFMTGSEPDAILSSFMNDTNISELTANNLLQPLTDYVSDPEIMLNFNERVLTESPGTLGVIASPDGEIYALPRYDANEGTYLESPMYINKVWLDKLGKPVPTTIEELEEVLIAFRDNDMNGNGKTDDEIPYLVMQGHWCDHFEAFMGLYGLPTKDGAYENYMYVEDGKVTFVPTTQAFKDSIIQLNDWYEKELIWQEAFTATSDTWNAKLSGTEAVVGLYMGNGVWNAQQDEYVVLKPVAVEGYEAEWYLHPGLMGVKSQFVVTRDCENVDVLLKWIDQFYSLEIGWRSGKGEEADGRYAIVDGTYVLNEELNADTVKMEELNKIAPTLGGIINNNIPVAYTAADYEEGRLLVTEWDKRLQGAYDDYSDYLNDEVWPRPYLASDVSGRISELRTDIFSTVKEKKAAWITGTADINAEWDAYCESLNQMNVDELITLMQAAYDNYMNAQK